MNLNIVNKFCWEWDKQTWRNAYEQYCRHNMFGEKTKREYYDWVYANHKRLEELQKPTPPELLQQWTEGHKAAKAWAKKHGCDINGRLLCDVRAENDERSAKEIAANAEDMAFESLQRLDNLNKKD